MENHPTTEGDAHGLSPEPAGSKPIDGDRRCPHVDGKGRYWYGHKKGEWLNFCPICEGIAVEPSVALRPGSSLFSPPAPSLDAGWAALAEAKYAALEQAVDAYKAALAIPDDDQMADAAWPAAQWSLKVAAVEFVAQMRKRAEGGLNAQMCREDSVKRAQPSDSAAETAPSSG
jgi:hypothetical protein